VFCGVSTLNPCSRLAPRGRALNSDSTWQPERRTPRSLAGDGRRDDPGHIHGPEARPGVWQQRPASGLDGPRPATDAQTVKRSFCRPNSTIRTRSAALDASPAPKKGSLDPQRHRAGKKPAVVDQAIGESRAAPEVAARQRAGAAEPARKLQAKIACSRTRGAHACENADCGQRLRVCATQSGLEVFEQALLPPARCRLRLQGRSALADGLIDDGQVFFQRRCRWWIDDPFRRWRCVPSR